MRQVLTIAVLILAALVAFDHCARRTSDRARRQTGAIPHVEVFSTGTGLVPPLELDHGNLAAIRAAGLFLHDPLDADGLHVATFANDGELLDFQGFPLATDGTAAARFGEHVSATAIGSFLVATVRGSIRPEGEDAEARRASLAATMRELDASARPEEEEVASWAFVAHRTATGWQAVGEAHSRRAGVALTVALARPGVEGEVSRMIEESSGSVTPLLARWDGTSTRPLAALQRSLTWANGTLDALVVFPGSPGVAEVSPGRVRWSTLSLADAPRFSTSVVVGPVTTVPTPVRLRLVIDGALVAERESLTPCGGEILWEEWEVDLAAFANRTVDFELVVDAPAELGGGQVAWGAPLIASP